MATVSCHQHNFLPGSWPFEESENTLAYTSLLVLSGSPILLVFHDHDGEWQFLHGEVTEEDECKIICIGCAFSQDSSIGILADLEPGWMAYRDTVHLPWQSEPYDRNTSIEV
jgi:hypothetical protein